MFIELIPQRKWHGGEQKGGGESWEFFLLQKMIFFFLQFVGWKKKICSSTSALGNNPVSSPASGLGSSVLQGPSAVSPDTLVLPAGPHISRGFVLTVCPFCSPKPAALFPHLPGEQQGWGNALAPI